MVDPENRLSRTIFFIFFGPKRRSNEPQALDFSGSRMLSLWVLKAIIFQLGQPSNQQPSIWIRQSDN